MVFRVQVDFSPAYELVCSLEAYTNKQAHRTLDLGPAWVERAYHKLRPEAAAEIGRATSCDFVGLLVPLIFQCPGERGAWGFLRWANTLSPAELQQKSGPYWPADHERVEDAIASRDLIIHLLRLWLKQYFSGLDPSILSGLDADAKMRRATLTSTAAEIVEAATGGILLDSSLGLEMVVLVPQYHFRPLNLLCEFGKTLFIMYPTGTVPAGLQEPSVLLLRLTRSLADPNRLRVLRILSEGARTLAEIGEAIGLSRSTVHHHIVTLRAASLVRVHLSSGPARFSLRQGALDEQLGQLRGFLARRRENVATGGEGHHAG